MQLSDDEAMTEICFKFMSKVFSKQMNSEEDILRAICSIRGFAEGIQYACGMSDKAFDEFGRTVISFAVLHSGELRSGQQVVFDIPPTWDVFRA